MRYEQTLWDGNDKTRCLRSGGSRISISKMDFEKSSLKVENDQKLWFFGAFWGILRHFQLKFTNLRRETNLIPDAPLYRIDRIFLHSQLSGFVFILISDGYSVGKSNFTSFENFLKDSLRKSRGASKSIKNEVIS